MLWHAIPLLREHRGDGHLAALLMAGLGACEALVVHGATGSFPVKLLRRTRAWPDADWDAATASMQERGWIDEESQLTDVGIAAREDIEAHTDRLGLGPWEHLGDEGTERLRQLVNPWTKAIVDAGTFAEGMSLGDPET